MNSALNKILIEHKKKLQNLSFKNKKRIICFSGIPGSGKTYLSKELEKKYCGIRIDSDEVRKIIARLRFKDKEKLLFSYLSWLIENFPFDNKLIILDSSVDRKYDKIKKIAVEHGFKLFLISIKASKRTAEKRVFKRNKGIDKHFYENIGRWIDENRRFNEQHDADIMIYKIGKKELAEIEARLNDFIN